MKNFHNKVEKTIEFIIKNSPIIIIKENCYKYTIK